MRIRHYAIALLLATPLVGCVGDTSSDRSALSGGGSGSASDDCTLTQGYWKNHPDKWPVSSLKLGTVSYTKVELIAILKTPVAGNGLVQLAHQLIAAKLNIAAGASDSAIKSVITQADALIGSLVCPPKGTGELATSKTSSLTDKLDAFNSGETGPGHCGENEGEDNDHGDETPDAGTGSDCGVAVCGNGIKEAGEECDDGNLINGDGCSSACTCECH